MKKIILTLSIITGLVSCIGVVKNKDGKDYVVPFSRSSRALPRVDEKGVKIEKKYLNEKDKSDEIIVYSDFKDAPFYHCERKNGHSIIKENEVTKKMERICRLDTPNSRVEGSKIEVEEVSYYIKNVENEYFDTEATYDREKEKWNEKTFADLGKFTRAEKEKIVREIYTIPEEELRKIYNQKLKEQYNIEK